MENYFFVLALITAASILDTITQLFLKSAINSLKVSASMNLARIKEFIFALIYLPQVWFALLFSILALSIWLFVLARAELSLAFSIGSVHYIFIAFSSKFLLKEKVGLTRWIGTSFIVIGIVLVSIG